MRDPVFSPEEIAFAFMALQELAQEFGENYSAGWPDDVKAAAAKACSVISRTGPVSSVKPFRISGR